MNDQEQKLRYVVLDIIDDYIDLYGREIGFEIDNVSDDKLFELAYRICCVNNDFQDVLREDEYREIDACLFALGIFPEGSEQLGDARKSIRRIMLNYYRMESISILEDSYCARCSEYFEENGFKFAIDEQTGEGSWS